MKKLLFGLGTICICLLIYYFRKEIISNYALSVALILGSMFLTIGLLFYYMIKENEEG